MICPKCATKMIYFCDYYGNESYECPECGHREAAPDDLGKEEILNTSSANETDEK